MASVVDSLKLSVEAAAAATLLAAPLGALLGWAAVRWHARTRIALYVLWLLPAPVLLYSVLSASPKLLWMALLGVLSASPMIAKSAIDALGTPTPAREKAARSLGLSHWRYFVRVIVPVARTPLALAIALGFLRVAVEGIVGLAVRR